MGVGVSLAFISLGAILAFALRVELSGIDIQLVGWILILAGAISMAFTLLYTRPRRRAGLMVGADPGYTEPAEPEAIIHEERTVEQTPNGPVEHVERVIERPGHVADAPRGHTSQDPARAQDPAIAQDPAAQNRPHATTPPLRRAPHERPS
ncbi:DUF6458 family protein [Actinomadura rudentiformis]|uniref:DUF6458 domain-containing protein n=1 Tax=Actinomadura rudentiformis TaxID=359158 RepID=A0A6H9YG60_9ACTN|nr:DUF6458 family protein [Actinomadura rudentiformis]KAB2344684.1 hypothetical protein F8566_29130 [Actinomadura rudentiformis]